MRPELSTPRGRIRPGQGHGRTLVLLSALLAGTTWALPSVQSPSYTLQFPGWSSGSGTAASVHYRANAAFEAFAPEITGDTNATQSLGGNSQFLTEPPRALGSTNNTREDTSVALRLDGLDPDGAVLTFEVVQAPQHGELRGTAPNLTYVPATNYFGADALEFVARNGLETSAPAQVRLQVSAVNDPPEIAPLSTVSATPSAAPLRLPIHLADPETSAEQLQLSVSSSQASVVPNHALTLEGAGPDRTLVIAFAGGGAGVTTLHLEVIDPEGANTTVEFRLDRLPAPANPVTTTLSDTGFALRTTVAPGLYRVDASEDLRRWHLIDLVESAAGVVSSADPTSRRHPSRFYRLRNAADPQLPVELRLERAARQLELIAPVEAGAYRLEASSDATHWEAVTRTNLGPGTFRLRIDAATPAARLYRLVRE